MLRSMKGVTNPRKIETNLGYTKVGPKKGKINDKPEKKRREKDINTNIHSFSHTI